MAKLLPKSSPKGYEGTALQRSGKELSPEDLWPSFECHGQLEVGPRRDTPGINILTPARAPQ